MLSKLSGQLRKQKEERLKSVVADSHTALGELRSRAQKHYEQQRQQRYSHPNPSPVDGG